MAAVAAGGVITFSCGPTPVTIVMKETAKIRNATGPKIVIDGGGLVTLSGGGKRRILYMNTCDKAQGWTTSHCQDQDHPRLTVQNLVFADGNATGETAEGGGGGAIFVRGGRLKVVNSRFVRNRCDETGPDLGGAAIRALGQHQGKPVYVVNSTFGGGSGRVACAPTAGRCPASACPGWCSTDPDPQHGDRPRRQPVPGRHPGGGSGGAIYIDGNLFTIRIAGSVLEENHANEGGGAVFFVSNDRTGSMGIEGSTLRRQPERRLRDARLPGNLLPRRAQPQRGGLHRGVTPGATQAKADAAPLP